MYVWSTVWSPIATISYGTVSDYGATYYENLFSRFIKILTGGSIYGGDRFDSTGAEVDVSKNGFYLGADGSLKANLQSLFRSNVIVGTDAGKNISNSGSNSNYNTLIGTEAGKGASGATTYFTTASGYQAGYALTSGYYNSLYGAYAGKSLTSGYYNTLFGIGAGELLTTGPWNVCIGSNAGSYLTGSPSNNTIIGNGSGTYLTGGGSNTIIGGSTSVVSLYTPTSTSNTVEECIAIGANARLYSEAGDIQINLNNRVIYLQFDSTVAGETVYDIMQAYSGVEAGNHETGCMGRFGIYHCSYLVFSGTGINFCNSAGTSLLNINTSSTSAIGQDLQICFVPPYYVLP